MKKLLILFIAAFALIGCQTEENEITGSLTIPERYWGEYTGVNSNFAAKIEKHKITVGDYVRTEGTITEDNGTTLFKADLENGEKLVLIYSEGCCIGITVFYEGEWLFASDYYIEN